jgi:hypothetical protein
MLTLSMIPFQSVRDHVVRAARHVSRGLERELVEWLPEANFRALRYAYVK